MLHVAKIEAVLKYRDFTTCDKKSPREAGELDTQVTGSGHV